MANSDGGHILLGVENDGSVSGIGNHRSNVQVIRNEVTKYCQPQGSSPNVTYIEVDKVYGEHTIVIVIVQPQTNVCYTDSGTVYVRDYLRDGTPGNRKLLPEEVSQLLISRGQVTIESATEFRASLDDLNKDLVNEYASKQSWNLQDIDSFLVNNGFAASRGRRLIPTNAGILLFGNNPALYLQRCDIDVVRFEGISMRYGAELNVVKDPTLRSHCLWLFSRLLNLLRARLKRGRHSLKRGLSQPQNIQRQPG
jgi:ATP-dependent DNA helicase RecG